MKKLSIITIIFLSSIFMSFSSLGQATGVFGGTSEVGGASDHSGTQEKWIKLAEMTLDGNYKASGMTVDFFPRGSNHGDGRERLIVQFRTNNGTGLYQSSYDISLVHMSGHHLTVKDVKVIQTSGSGVSNIKLAVWVQMGNSWLRHVPIEVRTNGVAGSCVVEMTNQPYYATIQDSGTVYEQNTFFAIQADTLSFDGTIKTEKVIVDPDAWPDYVFEEDYQLKSLEEVEAFITANGHLPNIAPADTMMANGVSLGEMDVKLLEKIEELTLYTIEQERQIKLLKDQVQRTKERDALLEELMKRVAELEKE
ncbi:MAG: hypothetical protein AAFO69_05615 [Bacteroidota bacterium]